MDEENFGGKWTTKRLFNEEKVGTKTGFSVLGGILFGTPFVVLGILGILAGFKVFGAAFEHGRHAPHWVFILFGLFFFMAGAGIWILTARMVQADKVRHRGAIEHGNHPAFADYPWNTSEFVSNPWMKVASIMGRMVVLAVFLVPFNYLVFKDAWSKGAALYSEGDSFGHLSVSALEKAPLVPALIIGVFDFILVWLIGIWAMSVVRTGRFGKGRLKWNVFPIAPGSDVVLNFELPRAITSFDQAIVELRCIKEFWETTGVGKKRRQRMVHEQIWSDMRTISASTYDRLACETSVNFSIPADAPPTAIAAGMPIFWRADLRIKMAGPDYVASFLVPVYAEPVVDFPVANNAVPI